MTESAIYSLDPAEVVCSGPWQICEPTSVEKIIPSIVKYGQFVPVLVAEYEGNVVLVAGRARFEAARRLNQKVSAVFIDAKDEISFLIAYLEENYTRTDNECVKSASFRFLASRMDQADIPDLLGPLLNIKSKSREMRFYMDWLELEPEFDSMLATGNIPLAAVSVLGKISAEDRASLMPFFKDVSWSRSNAVNFLTWLYETARRENCSVAALIFENQFTPAMEGESPKDSVARLCRAAKALRYPKLRELERAHARIVSEFCVGTRWKVEPIGSFETGEVMIQTRFKSREMMLKALSDLESITESESWETLFSLGGSRPGEGR